MAKRNWIVCSSDMSGLGWALMLQREGEDVVLAVEPDPEEEDPDGNALVGEGLVERYTMEQAVENADKNDYILFDSNKLSNYSEQFRKDGYKRVFGASAFTARTELDRAFAVSIAKKYGLGIPESVELSTRDEGLAFLDDRMDSAYVFKPNIADEHYRTIIPNRADDVAANRQVYTYLTHVDEKALSEGYILQELKRRGVEVNFEIWFSEGEAILATCGLETKLKGNHDTGTQVGCSSDIAFVLPLETRGIQETIGKMDPLYRARKYTGFADVNVILDDRKAWFLEVCNRFGYSFHPNLFMTLAIDKFSNIMADWIDGKAQPDEFWTRFRQGFGASVNLFSDKTCRGPLHVGHHFEDHVYLYDAYKDGDDLMTAGYSNDVAVFAQHGYTIRSAAEKVLHRLFENEAVRFIDNGWRSDLDHVNFTQSPIDRFEALSAMGYLDRV